MTKHSNIPPKNTGRVSVKKSGMRGKAKAGTDGGCPEAAKSMVDAAAPTTDGARLARLGKIVEGGKKAWRAVGAALDEINRENLYLAAGYESF